MGFAPLKVPNDGFYLLVGEQRIGPISLDEVKAKFDAKVITRSSYVWYAGLANWITVGDLPTFDRRDAAAPPEQKVPSQGTQLWVFDRGKVVAIDEAQLRSQIQANNFRRADLIFVDETKEWVRADQHPKFGALFTRNAPPLPGNTGIIDLAALQSESAPVRPRRTRPEKKKKTSFGFGYLVLIAIAAGIYFGRDLLVKKQEPLNLASLGSNSAGAFSGHELIFSLGAKADSVRSDPRFSRCALKPRSKEVYRCDLMHAALDRFEVGFTKQKVSKITVGFVFQPEAIELFKDTVSQFGKASMQTRQPCSAMGLAQKTRYSDLCRDGFAFLTWKGKDASARAMVAMNSGAAYPLELTLESLPQDNSR